jgi:hypothetical protein
MLYVAVLAFLYTTILGLLFVTDWLEQRLGDDGIGSSRSAERQEARDDDA